MQFIPQKYRHKCRISVEIGIDAMPNAIPDSLVYESGKEHLFKVLYVGRLLHWKGIHLGLKAYALFLKEVPDSRFTVIGDGPDQEWLQRLARRLGIEESITWMPWMEQREVMNAYSQHDVLLFPSLHDSSGNVVLEAMAQALPVVCLNLGGPPIFVGDNCGCVVDTEGKDEGDVVLGLSQQLIKLANNPDLRRRCAAEAQHRASAYSWDYAVERVYQKLDLHTETHNRL
jgi:glycosyltransferase involved in cell wall biosynthesis